jgi:hypothetical protein
MGIPEKAACVCMDNRRPASSDPPPLPAEERNHSSSLLLTILLAEANLDIISVLHTHNAYGSLRFRLATPRVAMCRLNLLVFLL